MANKTKKPEWQTKLQEMDGSIIGKVDLMADGFKVTFQNQPYKRKIVIVWFLDGVWKGAYAQTKSEIGQRFGRPMIIRNSKKHLEVIRKLSSKKDYNEAKQYSKIIGYLNYWGSTRALISHLKKTCKHIEVINL